MSKGNTTENDILELVFKGTALSWAGAGTLYVSLHDADPTDSGDQTSHEITYTAPYARQAVARSTDGWTVSGNQASNKAAITFPTCTGGTPTATFVAIGTTLAAAGQILYSGACADLAISSGIQPQFAIGALTITED